MFTGVGNELHDRGLAEFSSNVSASSDRHLKCRLRLHPPPEAQRNTHRYETDHSPNLLGACSQMTRQTWNTFRQYLEILRREAQERGWPLVFGYAAHSVQHKVVVGGGWDIRAKASVDCELSSVIAEREEHIGWSTLPIGLSVFGL